MQCNIDWDLENPFRSFSNAEYASPLSLTVVFRNEEGKKKKNSSHLHVVHKLCHEMEQDNQRASLICPARIDMLVRVSHNHGLNRKTWWECSSLERDDGLPIGCGALWKQHHMRPFVVNCSSPDIACCMVSWFCRHSVHRNNLKPKKKRVSCVGSRCEIVLMLLISRPTYLQWSWEWELRRWVLCVAYLSLSLSLSLSLWPYLLLAVKLRVIGKMDFVLTWRAFRKTPTMGISTFSLAETMTGKWR